MGLLGGIGKAIGGFAKKVSDVAGGVMNFANKAINFLQKPMEALTKPIKDFAGKALDKLPFGLGKLAKPFVDKFIDHGLSMLAGGPLGGLSMLSKALPTVQKIADFAGMVKGAADKVGALANPPAQFNFQQIIAHAQAQFVN